MARGERYEHRLLARGPIPQFLDHSQLTAKAEGYVLAVSERSGF